MFLVEKSSTGYLLLSCTNGIIVVPVAFYWLPREYSLRRINLVRLEVTRWRYVQQVLVAG